MSRLTIEESGVIFRNPLPGHRVINAFYPMVLPLLNNELICVVRLAAAIYAPGARLEIFRSADRGSTWQRQGLVRPAAEEPEYLGYSDAYLSQLSDGSLVLRAGRWNFSDPGALAFNQQTQGLLPIETCYFHSTDDGRTWSPPVVADFRGNFSPSQEPAPHGGAIELEDGSWFQVFETWKTYHDAGPFDLQFYGVFSNDQGRTWGDRVTVASGAPASRSYSHGIPMRLQDGRIMMSLWSAESQLQTSYDLHTVISTDPAAREWSEPRPTSIPGQTSCLAELSPGTLLCIYSHRENTDQPGIKVALSEDAGATWQLDSPLVVWDAYGKESLGVARSSTYPTSHDAIAYGAPKLTRLDERTAMASFWCSQGGDTHCRWCRIHVD